MDSLRAPSKPRRISNTWWHIHSTTPRLASAACGHDCEPRSGTASRMLGYDSHTAFSCLPWVSHVSKSFPYTSGLLRALSQVILKASHTCLTQGAADGSNGSISSVADWLQADNMHFLAPCSTRPRLTNVRLAPDGAARATSSSSKPLLVFVSPSPLQQPPHQTPTTATLPTDPSSRPSCRWQKLTLEVSPRSEALGPSARGYKPLCLPASITFSFHSSQPTQLEHSIINIPSLLNSSINCSLPNNNLPSFRPRPQTTSSHMACATCLHPHSVTHMIIKTSFDCHEHLTSQQSPRRCSSTIT
jgi:hypothetical protein